MKKIVRQPLVLVILLIAAPWAHAQDEDFEWTVAPYVWATSISTDIRTDVPPAETDTEFADIIDNLDGAFQIHVEGQGERFGVFTDFTYLGISADEDYARVSTDSDLDTRLFEAALVWSPAPGKLTGFEAFAGIRYIDVDLTVRFTPVNPLLPGRTLDGSASYTDAMLGARYGWVLSDRWGLMMRADTSFGDTDSSWNVSAIASYRHGNGQWAFGYRHLDVDLETSGIESNITLSGPIVGYGFRF